MKMHADIHCFILLLGFGLHVVDIRINITRSPHEYQMSIKCVIFILIIID